MQKLTRCYPSPILLGSICLGALVLFAYISRSSEVPPTAIILSCPHVMGALQETKPAPTWPPPGAPPPELAAAFRGPDDSMVLGSYYVAQRYEGAGEYVLDWNAAHVTKYCAAIASGESCGTYGCGEVNDLKLALQLLSRSRGGSGGLEGTIGMVMGSEQPWVECLALNLGAEEVWTFEYGRVMSTHPRLKAKPYKELAAEYARGRGVPLDWVVSFSSLEHSGLGRYGDPLNPEGDTEAMQQAWCMLKPGGMMLLAVPMSCRNAGRLEFNAHRVYGFQRLAHIAAGFELVSWASTACDSSNQGMQQPTILLRKPLHAPAAKLYAADFAFAASKFAS